jgi:translation initiation factor 6
MEVLRTALQVPVHKTTANFGNPLVGACVVANSQGIIAGERTTRVELVHIEDGLSVYD